MKAKKKNRALRIVIPVAIIALFGSLCSYWAIHLNTDDYLDKMLALMSLVVSALSAYFIVIQLKGEKAISEADFLVNLNQTFTSDAGYARVYTELEKELSDPPQKPQLSRIEISNYLTFFETIYLLIEEGVLDISAINDLFSYRFFLAVHSNCIQDMKLVKEPFNFRNIYRLEKKWMDYRKKNKLAVFREENCLEKSCERCGKKAIYENIINGDAE